jgi:hypothetical protein
MKISVQDLRPNPYRDITRYPISREKVEALKASIRSTGFWDNVLVRKSEDGDYFELAYGHHRLEALKELIDEKAFNPDEPLELCVRKIDDPTMIRIMANENVTEYRATAEVIDETIRVTREYIQAQTKTPLAEITPSDISQFLGGTWNEDKVGISLQRLGLFDRGVIKREQLKGLSHTAAKGIQREVAKVEKTMLRQKMKHLEEDEDVTEQERKRVRAQVQNVANHVAQVLSEHVRGGGTMSDAKERSLDAQAELIPEDAPAEERQLSTIDAAAKAVNGREFQRKVELLLRYREYMSVDARDELAVKLKEMAAWCKEMLTQVEG